jgi:vancomycin resistance protein VanW
VNGTHFVDNIQSGHPSLSAYQIYEKVHRLTQANWGGYIRHNTIYRKVYNGQGEEIDDEYVTENHAIMMYDPFLERPET